jgi:uncharacterized repeat protein (TIGR03803 family)
VHHKQQFCNSLLSTIPRTAMAVLTVTILVVLASAATPAALAQTFTVIHTFTGGADGLNPEAGLTIDGAGNLYGTTSLGGVGFWGVAFKLSKKGSGWLFNPLHFFGLGDDGAIPANPAVLGPDGSVYGADFYGGGPGYEGIVYNLKPPAAACKTALCPWTETILHRFQRDSDGWSPQGGVIFDRAGNLYGTTELGGLEGNCGFLNGTCGIVYKLTPPGSGWTEKVLYSFQNGNDGYNPSVALIFDRSGNLYGATSDGGTGGGGTVFGLTPSNGGWTLETLYSFTGTQGDLCGPSGALLMDGAGNLYGTTNCDGAYSYGNVFKLTPSGGGWTYTSLHDFTGGADGAYASGPIVFDASGNLYGTAYGEYGCDDNSCGVVWEITP